MENITIENYLILSAILIAITILLRIADIFIIKKSGKIEKKTETTELPNGTTIKTVKEERSYNIKAHRLLLIDMIIAITLALASLFTAAIFNKIALDYGAYGDYMKILTPKFISEMPSKSYKDQSNELPEDLKGKIIIYYRYDCADCTAIHDDLMNYLANADISENDIYFVSTRSDKGKTLIEQYYAYEVPSAVYIYNNAQGDTHYATTSLYQKITDYDIFLQDSLGDLIATQKAGV